MPSCTKREAACPRNGAEHRGFRWPNVPSWPPHTRNDELGFTRGYHSITYGRTGRFLRSLHKPTEIVFAGVPGRSAARRGTLTVSARGSVAVSRSVREDMPRVAADLLEAGYETPSLVRLAGEINVSSSADVEPLVALTFRELGVRYPITQTEADLIVSRHVAREVIAGQRNAWAAANYLEIVFGDGVRRKTPCSK